MPNIDFDLISISEYQQYMTTNYSKLQAALDLNIVIDGEHAYHVTGPIVFIRDEHKSWRKLDYNASRFTVTDKNWDQASSADHDTAVALLNFYEIPQDTYDKLEPHRTAFLTDNIKHHQQVLTDLQHQLDN